MSIGGHQSQRMQRDEWLTPPEILAALGEFDLDPCAPEVRPWAMAKEHFTLRDDGLSKPWTGRVWLNPPYGPATRQWMARLADHGDGIALIFARTETGIFFPHVWEQADAILFLQGRLHFHFVDGSRASANAGAPSVLVAYGERSVDALRWSGLPGRFVALREGST